MKVKILRPGKYPINRRMRAFGMNAEVDLPESLAMQLVSIGAAECICTKVCPKAKKKVEEKAVEEVSENKSLEPDVEKKTMFGKSKKGSKK